MNSQPESQQPSSLNTAMYQLMQISYLHRHHGYSPKLPVFIGPWEQHHSAATVQLINQSYEAMYLFNKPEIILGGSDD